LDAVRRAVGRDLAVVAKINLADGFAGGATIDDAVSLARALEARDVVDAIVPSGGFTSKTPFFLLRGGRPLGRMAAAQPDRFSRAAYRDLGGAIVRAYAFGEAVFVALARALRAAVKLPLVLLGGLVSRENLETAMREGFDFVALGRALIADPDLVARMQR